MNDVFVGKNAVITGGSSGIGREIALSLKNFGASVSIQGRHTLPGVESQIVDLDLQENQDIVLARLQKADILCIVHGPFLQKPLHETTPGEWSSLIYANLTFPGIMLSTVLPHMCEKKWGRILLFGGTRTDEIRGFRSNAAYASAKTGLSSLVKSVALEYARFGITCNAICPGFVDSGLLNVEQKRNAEKKNPDGKLISVKEIVDSALFLLTNSVLNGVLLTADKGWTPT